MTRTPVFAVAVGLAAVLVPAARADLPVAPPPREAGRPAGPAEDPAAVVERIIANSKAVGDKLARTDTGDETRSTQGTILKDIDALIDREENPPPSGGGGGGDDQNKSDQKNDQNQQGQGQGGGQGQAGQQPKGGKGGSGQQGGNQQAGGRRPRGGGKGQPKPQDQGKDETGMANAGNPKDGKDPQPGGGQPAGKDGKGGKAAGAASGTTPKTPPPRPTVPLDDEVAKEVWGHLPDKVRQQVTQYYKEEFMPRYADLLKQYYASLATTPPKGAKP